MDPWLAGFQFEATIPPEGKGIAIRAIGPTAHEFVPANLDTVMWTEWCRRYAYKQWLRSQPKKPYKPRKPKTKLVQVKPEIPLDLTQAFRVLGGVPRRGIFDNMKTAVDRIGAGKTRQVNARFSAMASHYLFEPEFCNPAAGWEKGQVEKNVQDARRRLWQPLPSLSLIHI